MQPTTTEKRRVLFVGEYPTKAAARAGKPTGTIMSLLSNVCGQGEIDSWAFTYAVKEPPEPNKKPGVKIIRADREKLLAEIALIQPEVIVPLGNIGLRSVMEKHGITKYAGRETTSDVEGFEAKRVIPMISPMTVARNPDPKAVTAFESAFSRLAEILADKDVTPIYEKLEGHAVGHWLREAAISDEPYFSIDLETNHLNPRFGTIRTVAIRIGDETRWFEWDGTNRLRRCLLKLLRSDKWMIAHNAGFELKWLLHHVCIPLCGVPQTKRMSWRVACTLQLHHLLDENANHDLSTLSKVFTDKGGYDDAMESALLENPDTTYANVDVELLGQYNGGDADVTYELYEIFIEEIVADKGLKRAYVKIVEPAIWAVAWAEYEGRRIDAQAVAGVRYALEIEEAAHYDAFMAQSDVAEYIKHECGGNADEFNPNSGDQLAVLLKDYSKVPLTEKSDSGKLTVRKAVLEYHAPKYPIIQHYLGWKAARTLRNNYLGQYRTAESDGKAVLGFVEADGFLYGGYLLHGTTTGRLASRSPNLQNFKKQLRTIVRSRFPGTGRLVEADYSQLELRLMAWLSGCGVLLAAYEKNTDVHTLTASLVLNKPVEDVTPEDRQNFGKRPNFGLTYGAFPKRFALEFQMDLDEAKDIHRKWHDAYPEIGAYLQKIQAQAESTGVVRSFMGRARRVPDAQLEVPYYRGRPDYKHENWKPKIAALLSAGNFPVQSLGSDLNTWAAAKMRVALAQAGMDTVQIGFTHDSATYDCPNDREEQQLRLLLQEVMVDMLHEAFPKIGVPMAIDINSGDSWGDL